MNGGFSDGWFWYSTPWATGGVLVSKGKIVETCPIFRKMLNCDAEVMKKYEYCMLAESQTYPREIQ